MRPVMNTKPDVAQFDYPVGALLMMSMGECCAMCERPLLAESLVWDRDKEQVVQGKTNADEWANMLLLCHNCGQDAETSKTQNISSHALVYPDRQLTFGLTETSLFQYELEKVEQVQLDENNKPIGETITKEVVLIKGGNEAAQQTIDFFKLNSHYYNQEKNTFFLPMNEDPQQLDRRLDLRTQAWQRADSFVQLFKQTDHKDVREALASNVRNSISHSGFWSVWVTRFWQAFEDKEMIRMLFGNPKEPEQAKGLQNEVPLLRGQGPHNHFVGTNDGWLD